MVFLNIFGASCYGMGERGVQFRCQDLLEDQVKEAEKNGKVFSVWGTLIYTSEDEDVQVVEVETIAMGVGEQVEEEDGFDGLPLGSTGHSV